MMRWALAFSVFILFSGLLPAQPSRRVLKKLADEYFEAGRYGDAQKALEQLQVQVPNEEDNRQRLGICYFHTNKLQLAEAYLTDIANRSAQPDPVVLYYLGAINHQNHLFSNAIQFYKDFLRQTPLEHPWREMVKEEIKRCAFGKASFYSKLEGNVQNLGPNVNTPGDEFAPVVSPNYPGKIYFSAARLGTLGDRRDENGLINERTGKFCADMFSSTTQDGTNWSKADPLSYLLNSPKHEVLLDFSQDGSKMYFFKGFTLHGGSILVDTFKRIEEKTFSKESFKSPVQPEKGDVSIHFFNDSIILFSSRRAGGFGGLDLYVTRFESNYWSLPQNLGPHINSNFDETAPFLAADGRTLYFSSNSSDKTFGGFDIFRSRFDDQTGTWSPAENLGPPINSAGDDSFFRISKDGSRAYFSSSRKTGLGQRDIFTAIFPFPLEEMRHESFPLTFLDISPKRRPGNVNARPLADNTSKSSRRSSLYNLGTLYYNQDRDLTLEPNLTILKELASLLLDYPEAMVLIEAHSDGSESGSLGLFLSAKRAEKVLAALQNLGVSDNQVLLKGCGSNLPVARESIDGQNHTESQKLNRRITFSIFPEDLKSRISYKEQEVVEILKSPAGEFFRKTSEGLSYKVELASSTEFYDGDLLKVLPNGTIDKTWLSPNYSYTAGLYKTFASANELMKQLLKNGISNARVIPYINGFRVDKETLKKLAGSYPDLENYLSESGN